MAIPAVTREYTPGASATRKNSWDFPLAARWGPIPLHFMLSSSVFPIKDVRNLNFPDGTEENPQEHCHNRRRTLLSPQECRIDWCTPNQLKMKHISLSLNPYPSHIPHHIQQVAWHPLQQYRDCLRHPSQVYRKSNFSKATGRKIRSPHIVWRWELIPCFWMKR